MKKKIRVCEITASGLLDTTIRTANRDASKVIIEELVKNGNDVSFTFVDGEEEI